MPKINVFQQLALHLESPEKEFEAICCELIRLKNPDARRVRVHLGDGGVDSATGTWGSSGALDVFQVKYFIDVWGDSQKQQIRESYKTAANCENYNLRRWTLCLPVNIRKEDLDWFDTWKSDKDHVIDLWDGADLEALLRTDGASRTRGRMRNLGVTSLDASPNLQPYISKVDNPLDGVDFNVHLSLTNEGDKTAENITVLIVWPKAKPVGLLFGHDDCSTNRVSGSMFEVHLRMSLNPNQSLLVIRVACCTQEGIYQIQIRTTCQDAGSQDWSVDLPTGPFEQLKLTKIEANPLFLHSLRLDRLPLTYPLAKIMIEEIRSNPNTHKRGLTVMFPPRGAFIGQKMYLPIINGGGQPIAAKIDVLNLAVQELVTKGYLNNAGIDGHIETYTVV